MINEDARLASSKRGTRRVREQSTGHKSRDLQVPAERLSSRDEAFKGKEAEKDGRGQRGSPRGQTPASLLQPAPREPKMSAEIRQKEPRKVEKL
jgi:hypothetical protein